MGSARNRRLVLVTAALWAMLSGCAEWTKSDLPVRVRAAVDLQCCRNQATDAGSAVSTFDVEAAREAIDAAGHGLCRFEVARSESPLRRDALGRAPIVGRVVPGEKLTFLDFIDRRLRILSRIVFDGGHWRKVRGQRGDVGWLPASEVRETRGPCEAEGVAMNGKRRAPEQAGP